MENTILVTRSSMPSMEEYINEVKSVWDSHWLTNMGPKHNAFQSNLKSYLTVLCLNIVAYAFMDNGIVRWTIALLCTLVFALYFCNAYMG